jgi:outer membrane protein assembly factor BamB
MRRLIFPALIASILTAPPPATAGDWLQFRGPASGSAAESGDQIVRPDLAVAWQADLPGRGLSSPLVIGGKVVVTAASGPEQVTLHVLCFDRETGERLWERSFRATGRTMTHKKTCVAAPTPCSDGEAIYAYYSSNDLVCLDLDGNLRWLRGLMLDYPNASNSLGMASSPVVSGGVLVVQSENDSESIALGIDTATGENRWLMQRPKAANWTSAVLHGGTVALQSSKGLTGIEPASGTVLWDYTDGAATIPSAAVAGSVLYVPSHGITALEPEQGAATQRWRSDKLSPGTASPLVHDGALYIINKAGVLVKGSLETGDELGKTRLKGPFSGSPVASGDHLFIISELGLLQVIDPRPESEASIVHTVNLDDTVLGSPSVSGNALLARSDSKLWLLK